jgi:putative ABC transport system substrate-binding protein
MAGLAAAQMPAKIPRIGYLSGRHASSPGPLLAAFRGGLRKLHYVEGKNLIVDYRFDTTSSAAFQRAIHELVSLKVNLLVVPLQVATAKRLVKNLPIVMIINFDPVDTGVIDSLNKPGGNITGVTTLSRALTSKRLELLKAVAPQTVRLGVLRNTDSLNNGLMQVRGIEAAGRELDMKIELVDVHSATPDLDGAFQQAAKARIDALLTLTPMLINQQKTIAELGIKYRIPTVFEGPTWVQAGGLLSYAADEPELFRRAASYVDKILKGAKPQDLPVEEPKKFEVALNLRTAKMLGLTIPAAVLKRADKLIK